MEITLLRHATLLLRVGRTHLLVDPMLSAAGAMDPVRPAEDERRCPLVKLPLDDAALQHTLGQLDGVLVSHTHRDHWDPRAAEIIPKHLPVLCQPPDAARLAGAGFEKVLPVADRLEWQGVDVARTGGRHGRGEMAVKMGPVSGFVLRAPGEPVFYLVGDSVWVPEVEEALAAHRPGVIVVNAGAAQFSSGGPLTMTAEDVAQLCRARPQAAVVAVHMEAFNHCNLSRAALRAALDAEGLAGRVQIPQDGETLAF
jgi:L-ascorbate metabolism protein UlaG (beta-lactamase superfamily)